MFSLMWPADMQIVRNIITTIIHMKKLLASDWLRAVQFKCNTSANYDWQKDNGRFSRRMISCKTMTKVLYGNFEKSFLRCEKMVSRNIFWHFLRANFFMFVSLISKSGPCNVSFLKNSLVQVNSKLNSKPCDYLCKEGIYLGKRVQIPLD